MKTMIYCSGWRLEVKVQAEGERKAEYVIRVPYGDRNNNFAYFPGDGWVDIRLPLRSFAGKQCTLTFNPAWLDEGRGQVGAKLSLSAPHIVRRKTGKSRTVLVISLESLSDLRLLENKYGLASLPHLERLCRIV